jgi:flagellar FliJ protein
MTTDLRALLIVLDRERERRDGAAVALREAENRLAQALSRGRTLLTYRADTADRWCTPQDRTTSTPQLQTAHSFLQRLDAALEQHGDEHRLMETLVRQRRAQLVAAETRVASLDRLVERRQRVQRQQQQQREQRADDERAQAMATLGVAALALDSPHDHPDLSQARPC